MPNISQSKRNRTMKFGQLIEHNRVIKLIELQEKDFSSKNMQKMRQEDMFETLFYFFKKNLI